MNKLKALALSSMLFAGAAVAAPNIHIGSDTIGPGGSATIPLTFQSEGSVSGLDFVFSFDPSEFTAIEACNAEVSGATIICDVAANTIRVFVSAPFQFPVPTIPAGDQALGSIIFTANEDSPYNTYDLLLLEENFFDPNANPVTSSGSFDGSIVVADPVVPGDANGDGFVNEADIQAVIEEYFGVSVAPGKPDCNLDGQVNSGDVICISNTALGG